MDGRDIFLFLLVVLEALCFSSTYYFVPSIFFSSPSFCVCDTTFPVTIAIGPEQEHMSAVKPITDLGPQVPAVERNQQASTRPKRTKETPQYLKDYIV